MSQTLTKPILLDETGQAIKQALQNIDETEAQDWLLTYEDVHSEMDDNVDRIADALESIKDVLEGGEWYPKGITVEATQSNYIITNITVTADIVKDIKTSYIVGDEVKHVDITNQCTLSKHVGDYVFPDDCTVTATWVYGLTGVEYTDSCDITVYVPPFDSVNFSQLQILLNAHYAGNINLHNYWSVGDELTINMPNIDGTGAWTDEFYKLVILNAGGKELTTPISGTSECAFVVGFKTLLFKHTSNTLCSSYNYAFDTDSSHYRQASATTTEYTGDWSVSTLRTWLNGTFKNIDISVNNDVINSVFKEFVNVSGGQSGSVTTNDYWAVASAKEIYGQTHYDNLSTAFYDVTGEDDEIQFDYYKTSANRIKTVGYYDEDRKDNVALLSYTRTVGVGSFTTPNGEVAYTNIRIMGVTNEDGVPYYLIVGNETRAISPIAVI